ncbi:hypothetical protein FRB93_006203 [Tulasnella sp. JGI-2019a]|nr:hypothetical protein FRB93_006203 [Tulasnella sp. JGI-2019a]
MSTKATSPQTEAKGKGKSHESGPMELVDGDIFLKRLGQLFEDTKEKGTVWLTHKRYTYDGTGDVKIKMDIDADGKEYPCLVRATDGHKKFETLVMSADLYKFHVAYGALLKASMTAHMRKRDKKKERKKAEDAALRKKKLSEDIVIVGAKRGNGRSKRQRRVKAAIKLEEARSTAAKREEQRLKAEELH